jgi:hypothetical protein
VLVFLDESGDPGFKIARGSTPVFVAAMAIFWDTAEAARTGAAIDALRHALGVKPEFKFNKASGAVRDAFFQAILPFRFAVRAIAVQKERIYSPHLRAEKERFYNFFVKSMLKFDGGQLENARIIIDGSGDREFRNNLKVYLRRHAAAGAIKEVRFKRSHGDSLVQLADMCAGAIARSYRQDRPTPERWRVMLAPKIRDVWDFK